MSSSKTRQTQVVLGAAAAVASAALLYYLVSSSKRKTADETKDTSRDVMEDLTSPTKTTTTSDSKTVDKDQTPLVKNGDSARATTTDEHKELHARIEELDKKGKEYFRAKQVSSISGIGCRCFSFLFGCRRGDFVTRTRV